MFIEEKRQIPIEERYDVAVCGGRFPLALPRSCCAVTGQAAGTAAALSNDFPSLDVKILQQALCDAGVVLHENTLDKGENR